MSSSYYILCVSHDPATSVCESSTPESAVQQIGDGIEGHYECDLMIERVSGGPVEIGCPPSAGRQAPPRCCHRDAKWIDVEWLRLLSRAYNSTDPRMLDAIKRGRFTCWTPDRLHRLRYALGEEQR